MRFLFYSHDGLGLGHVRRHLAIASALVALCPKAQILLATSIDEVSDLGLPPNVDTLKLPGLRKLANGQYAPRRLGGRTSDIHALRAALLRAAVESFRPAVLLVDKHPLGVASEFLEALQAAKAQGARAVLGLRDILDDPTTVRREWRAENLEAWVEQLYDAILIYGNQAVFDPLEEYGFHKRMAARARFCGYVVNKVAEAASACERSYLQSDAQSQRPLVLATAGGGEDGAEVIKAFIKCARGASWRGAAVTGPLLNESEMKRVVEAAAANDVLLLKFVPSLSHLFPTTAALVCMGGYNTLVEAASEGLPAVCVPRVSPRAEQLLRAERFEQLGLLRIVHPQELSVHRLRLEIDSALSSDRKSIRSRAQASLQLDGASRAALELMATLSTGPRVEPALMTQVHA